MAQPGMIGGPRFARNEMSGDKRRFEGKKIDRKKLLVRLLNSLGRNRLLLILAISCSVLSSVLALYGPKLSGEALDAIDLGTGNVAFDIVYRCAILMAIFYVTSSVLGYLLRFFMVKLSRSVTKQMRRDIFNNLTTLPVS